MKITQTIHLNADIQTIWPFIADPDLHTLWNPDIQNINRKHKGIVKEGEVFEVAFTMAGRPKTRLVTVLQRQQPDLLVFEHHMNWRGKDQVTVEMYRLMSQATGVHITLTNDLSRSKLPWFIVLLVRLIQLFKKDLRPKMLINLKELIENPPEIFDDQV